MKKFWVLPILLATVFANLGEAGSLNYYHSRFLKTQKHSVKSHATEFHLMQKTDPKNPQSPLFSQRYYVDSTYAENTSSPVFFYLCGEATCNANELNGSITEHAKLHKGYLVALEHRYYGESQPFDSLTKTNLKYLSVENAIEDAATFQRFLQNDLKLTGPWFVVGGSYAGALSAYYRLKHPELVAGSLASSGPVRAEANFDAFDKHVTEAAGADCAPLIRGVSKTVEASLNNPEALNALKEKFQATAITDGVDFLYLVADMGAMAIQYGYRDTFCKSLASGDPVEAYAAFTRQIFQTWHMTALDDSVEGAFDLDPKSYEGAFGARQWFYQSCTEFGFWQNAYPDPNLSVRSTLINPAYHQSICSRLFQITTPVNTDGINNNFYQPLLTLASNILFTNGSRDPWSELGITDANNNATNANTKVFSIVNGAHCDDLGVTTTNDSASLTQAKQMFDTLIDSIL